MTRVKERFSPVPSDILVTPHTLTKSANIATLAARLDLPNHDRSRRDFAIVCGLLRLGLSAEEIWAIVVGKSKFETGGRAYFELTLANAEQAVSLAASSPAVPELPA